MRRFALACFLAALAIVPACGSNATTPPDLTTITGQVLQGTVPAAAAYVYPFDRSQILGAVGDASLLTMPNRVLADGTGHFTIYGFGSFYDLAIAPHDAPLDLTLVRGLTRRDPLVTLPAVAGTPFYSCHIDMSWNAPPPAGSTVLYFLQGGFAGSELISVKQTDTNYLDGLDATWRNSYSTSPTLWVVVYTQDAKTGLPTAWNGFAAATVELVNQRETSFFTVLQTTTSSTMTVAIQAPNGYAVDSADVRLDLGSGTGNTIAHFDATAAATSPLTISIPDLPGNRLLVSGLAHNTAQISYGAAAAVMGTADKTTSVQLQFADASQLTSPSDAATVSQATSVSWQGDGVNELSFSSTSPNAPSLTVITNESSIPFGELLLATGAGFPAGANVTWSSRRYPDIGTTDFLDKADFDVSMWRSATSASRSFVVASP